MNYAIVLASETKTKINANITSCLVPILGKPMISYIIKNLEKTQIDKILCVASKQGELGLSKVKCNMEVILQNALLEAMRYIKEDGYTLILPANIPFLDSDIISDFLSFHQRHPHKLTIGTFILNNPYGYGRIKRKNRKVVQVIHEDYATKTDKWINEVFSGVMCINNQRLIEILPELKAFNSNDFCLTSMVNLVLKKMKVETYMITDKEKAQGIYDFVGLSLAEEKFREQINLDWMRQGVRIENYKSVLIGPEVRLAEQVTIYSNTKILGNSEIHSGAVIGPNATLIDAVIHEDALIQDSVIEESIVKKGAKVGPYAHVRFHTIVGEFDRIGNFVELKNTNLGHHTNAAHLAYIGDTLAGNGVNFGCGIVTVNYDGVHKNTTTIGNNVFIGCNSNLIAPIQIKNNSYIAAGSTITMDVEECDFVIARAKETIKKGYALKFGYKKVED